jgi:hypothetical protein
MQTDNRLEEWTGSNPMLTFCMAPLLIMNWWTRALMLGLPRAEEPDKNAPCKAQLSVPRVLQESKDSDLFA